MLAQALARFLRRIEIANFLHLAIELLSQVKHVPVRQSILVILLHKPILRHQLLFEGVHPVPDLWVQILLNLHLDQRQVAFLPYSFANLLIGLPEQVSIDHVLMLFWVFTLHTVSSTVNLHTHIWLLMIDLCIAVSWLCLLTRRLLLCLRHVLQIANIDYQLRIEVLNHGKDLVLCVPPGVCLGGLDKVPHLWLFALVLLTRPAIISMSLASTHLPLSFGTNVDLSLVDWRHSPEDSAELSHQ